MFIIYHWQMGSISDDHAHSVQCLNACQTIAAGLVNCEREQNNQTLYLWLSCEKYLII